ncbi:hypothetical protein TYRP_001772 [Tyrophagus putrescentiae]|nr:hypothetical protein TYRP_001772 [Tyrophagus putrescentiae]
MADLPIFEKLPALDSFEPEPEMADWAQLLPPVPLDPKRSVLLEKSALATDFGTTSILNALLRNVTSLQVHNSQLAERLKNEKVAHKRLQLLQSEQCQALSDQVEHLEAELIVATRHQVTCSICLDSVDEILTSSPTTPKRSLLVTFCGHLFCDLCLKRSFGQRLTLTTLGHCKRPPTRAPLAPLARPESVDVHSAQVSSDLAALGRALFPLQQRCSPCSPGRKRQR